MINKALSKSQAKAVHDSITVLAKVSAVINFEIEFNQIEKLTVSLYDGGGLGINVKGKTVEEYDNLIDFANNYGILK